MQLIDTHAHLYLDHFDTDRQQAVKRAVNNGIGRMLLPNVDQSTIEPMLKLSNEFPGKCIPMIAIHPTSIKKNYEKQIELVEEKLNVFNFCAIGETGIDLYWDKTFFKQQLSAFEKHIELAISYNLPLVIHSRSSLKEIFDVLENYKNKNLRGVFHCFPGDTEQAYKVIELGFMIGVGGVITYKNSKIKKVVEEIDLNNILIETDAPYLAPVPKRGKRNESSYLIYIAEKIAEIKNTNKDKVANITTKNAVNLFKLNNF